jgi:anti-sigma factor RsiW
MNQDGNDDLLTGFFDGELSAAERARAEELLKNSAEARHELAEIARLSAILRSTGDAIPVPEGLLEQTRLQVEQAVQAAPLSAARGWRRYRRELLAGCTGVLATVATLMLAFRISAPSAPSDSMSVASLNKNVELSVANPVLSAWDKPEHEAMFSRFGTENGTGGFGRPAPAAATLAGTSPAEPAVALGLAVTAPMPAPAAAGVAGANSSNDGLHAAVSEKLGRGNTFEVGSIVPYLNTSGPNGVAVMEVLTVLDVEPAADRVQVLLTRNGFATVQDERAAGAETPRRVKTTPGSSELVTVLVDAPGDRLAQALTELEQEPYVEQFRLMPPLDLPAPAEDEVQESKGKALIGRQTQENLNQQLAQTLADRERQLARRGLSESEERGMKATEAEQQPRPKENRSVQLGEEKSVAKSINSPTSAESLQGVRGDDPNAYNQKLSFDVPTTELAQKSDFARFSKDNLNLSRARGSIGPSDRYYWSDAEGTPRVRMLLLFQRSANNASSTN